MVFKSATVDEYFPDHEQTTFLQQVMDMVILMDEQVPQTQWNICINFLVRLVEGLNVASGKTYVAFVLYNRNGARVVINLNRFSNNKAALIAAIRGTSESI